MNEALLQAAKDGKVTRVQRLLRDGSAQVNCTDTHGFTPLFYACSGGHIGIVKLLVENSADVNIKNFIGWTALHYCIQHGHVESASYLIDHGADPFAKNNSGKTPLDLGSHKITKKLLLQVLTGNHQGIGEGGIAGVQSSLKRNKIDDALFKTSGQLRSELAILRQQQKEEMDLLRAEHKAEMAKLMEQMAQADSARQKEVVELQQQVRVFLAALQGIMQKRMAMLQDESVPNETIIQARLQPQPPLNDGHHPQHHIIDMAYSESQSEEMISLSPSRKRKILDAASSDDSSLETDQCTTH